MFQDLPTLKKIWIKCSYLFPNKPLFIEQIIQYSYKYKLLHKVHWQQWETGVHRTKPYIYLLKNCTNQALIHLVQQVLSPVIVFVEKPSKTIACQATYVGRGMSTQQHWNDYIEVAVICDHLFYRPCHDVIYYLKPIKIRVMSRDKKESRTLQQHLCCDRKSPASTRSLMFEKIHIFKKPQSHAILVKYMKFSSHFTPYTSEENIIFCRTFFFHINYTTTSWETL